MMKSSFKPIAKEFLWLAACLLITLTICRFVFMWDESNATLDLHLHDTYFVFTAASIIIPLFLLVTFVLFFFKEIRLKFSRTLPNIIMISAGLLLVTLFAYANKEFIKMGISPRWTSYPPFSEVNANTYGPAILDQATILLTNSITVIQIVVTASLLYVTFCWGRQFKYRS